MKSVHTASKRARAMSYLSEVPAKMGMFISPTYHFPPDILREQPLCEEPWTGLETPCQALSPGSKCWFSVEKLQEHPETPAAASHPLHKVCSAGGGSDT